MMTRRTAIGSGVMGLLVSTLPDRNASAANRSDVVVDAVNVELAAMFQRAMKDPGNVELLRSIGSQFRVLDSVAAAHDLKRHQKKARPVTVDGNVAEHMARQLQTQGFKVTGDDLVRRHLEARSRGIDVAKITQQATTMMASEHLLRETSMIFDAIAIESAGPSGISFREGLHDPKSDWRMRQASSWNACGWFRSYGGAWGLMFGIVAFAFTPIPELAALGTAYGVASLFFDGATVYCEF